MPEAARQARPHPKVTPNMPEKLTEEAFRQHLNTTFRVRVETPRPLELELVEVKGYAPLPNEEQRMERFSIFFHGPPDMLLHQGSHALEHEVMGEVLLFLVPVAQNESGFRYEAVFNSLKM
jgi:hypothetical protein